MVETRGSDKQPTRQVIPPNDPQMIMVMTQSLRRFDLVSLLQRHRVYNLSGTRRDGGHRNVFSLLNEI